MSQVLTTSDFGIPQILGELPLSDLAIAWDAPGQALLDLLQQQPIAPGVSLYHGGAWVGYLSRRQVLTALLSAAHGERFRQRPLQETYNDGGRSPLILAGETPILPAEQQAIKRPEAWQLEPLVVRWQDRHWLLDFAHLHRAAWQIRGIETQIRWERQQLHLLAAHRLASLGRLVDGVAHEILDPVGFIWGNLHHLQRYSQDLLTLIAAYEAELGEPSSTIADLRETIDLAFLMQDLPRVLGSVQGGAQRLKHLSRSLQNFCHLDEVYPKPADLHGHLDSILLLLRSHLRSEIHWRTDYGAIPPLVCHIGQLNQALMLLLLQRVDGLLAIAVSRDVHRNWPEDGGGDRVPEIRIATAIQAHPTWDRALVITLEDNGPPLGEAVGQWLQGEGQGEAIWDLIHQVITAKHGGQIKLSPQDDHHCLEIWLPLYPTPKEEMPSP